MKEVTEVEENLLKQNSRVLSAEHWHERRKLKVRKHLHFHHSQENVQKLTHVKNI